MDLPLCPLYAKGIQSPSDIMKLMLLITMEMLNKTVCNYSMNNGDSAGKIPHSDIEASVTSSL